MTNTKQGSEYLPKHFWYPGMNKAKAGKGYRDGKPVGTLGMQCQECEGTVINIRICYGMGSEGDESDAKNVMETTTEKVCDTCGLVYQGAYQTLDRYDDHYTTVPFDGHEVWKERMIELQKAQDSIEDIDSYAEVGQQLLSSLDDNGRIIQTNPVTVNQSTIRLYKAMKRLSKTPQSMKISRTKRRTYQYHLIADDYIHILELNKLDAKDVHYVIEHRKNTLNTRYKMEDIIYHICLIVGNKDLRKYPEYNRSIYNLLTDRLGR